MQKPQGGGKILVQMPGGARAGGWLWMKLIPALLGLDRIFKWSYDYFSGETLELEGDG